MNCFKLKRSKTSAKTPSQTEQTQVLIPENRIVMHEVLLKIKDCKVHLMDEEDALELANGDFEVFRVSDSNISLATTIKVGDELQWPLTKDEPVVKLDALHYLFSLPMKDDKALSYGVTFSQKQHGDLSLLDAFLKENSLFTSAASSSSRKEVVNWKEFAPAVDEYNSVLARAIAGGTGQIVKGIFKCSNAYSNQVQMGGETILIRAVEDKKRLPSNEIRKSNSNVAKKKSSAVNQSLKRVRKLSKMTEKLSKTMLDAVGVASGSVIVPVVRSGPGKNLLSMVPGEVLLASLDAVNKIIDAAEAAEKQAMAATSGAVTRMVTERFGESAGEATEDALATAGHCAGTAWNVFKIRKAINPALAAVPSELIKRKP
ncbi:senescence/dehydration-associated protein At4g35985, chloroplastic-like [Primulina tabacum]|uniref:senescence/dehydration-associated protein At4g35985, chloroplastic-like n=1 Tax=Primulina tabacum TaxID=48773 RepID=UPI003F5A7BFD